jgi:NADPH:quinone reductase-like Zn-dependent oxidoreductase
MDGQAGRAAEDPYASSEGDIRMAETVGQRTTMSAFVQDRYGSPDVLAPARIARPVIGPDDVLVRVAAASVNPADWHVMRGLPYIVRVMGFGLRAPKSRVRGQDVAGTVEAVGANVVRLRVGDAVFGEVAGGAFAEYVSVPAARLAVKPAHVTFVQAAAVPLAASTALEAVQGHGRVQAGQKVLVNGASGGVGTFAVQIAKAFGAEVAGVCGPGNVDLVRSIGADHVIDYTRDDFTRGGQRYDLIVDVAGSCPVAHCRRVLAPTGTYVVVGGPNGPLLGPASHHATALATNPFVSQRMIPLGPARRPENIAVLAELLDAGTITPVIDRTYPLAEVADAIRYLEQGHVRGKVVVTV